MNDFSLRTSHSLSWYGSAKPSHTPFTKVVRHLAFTSCKHYISPTPPLPPLPRFIAAFRLLKRKIYQIGTSTDCAENSLFASWKRRVTTYEPFPTLGHVFSNFEHRSRCWNDPYCTAPLHSVTGFSFSEFTSCQKGFGPNYCLDTFILSIWHLVMIFLLPVAVTNMSILSTTSLTLTTRYPSMQAVEFNSHDMVVWRLTFFWNVINYLTLDCTKRINFCDVYDAAQSP